MTVVLAAVAVLLVGCGGGDDSAPSSQNSASQGPSTLEQGVLNVVCFLVTLFNPGCFDNDGTPRPDTSTTATPDPNEPVCHGPERCIEGGGTLYLEAFDVEPNDSISTASVASFRILHDPELLVAFYVEGTINNLTDGVDTYAFTATRSRTFVFQLCGGTFADRCRDGVLDVAIAYFSVLDQFGNVLLNSQGNSVNYQLMRIDAGVLYYVSVIAEDIVNENQTYTLTVREAITQPELEVPQDPDPDTPTLSAGEVMWLTATLDWMPSTMNVDGTPLTDLAGYNVYFGPAPGMYLDFRHLDNPGLVTYVLDLPSSGSWFIVVTALDSAGNESDFSNEVVVDVICECDLPPPPWEMP